MDITAETIQKILNISAATLHAAKDAHGVATVYSDKPLHQVKADPYPVPKWVDVTTIAGLVDLINANLEWKNYSEEYLLHIEDETSITLKAKKSDEYGRRQILVKATPVPFQKFRFGQWLNQDEFIIGVASLFADSPDKDYVLKMASTLTNEAIMTSEDDGFSQRATAKAGMRLKESVNIKPRVDLAPYRTFPEVAQPVSSFVLRAKCEGEGKPQLMLVEADGGRWKIDAINTVREKLDGYDLNIPVVA